MPSDGYCKITINMEPLLCNKMPWDGYYKITIIMGTTSM